MSALRSAKVLADHLEAKLNGFQMMNVSEGIQAVHAIRALIEEVESYEEGAAIFDWPQGAWRGPLGALRLTLTGEPEKVDVPRAQHECEQLVKVLNGVKE